MSKTKPAAAPVSASPKPAEHDGTDLDTIAEHALTALATRFAKASGAIHGGACGLLFGMPS